MPGKRFQKRKEDFVCEHCDFQVKGTGWTDHCPNCLWSKHVDLNPGDRRAECQGMMKPVGLKIKNGEYIIYYQCLKCGYRHQVRAAPEDNFEELLELSKKAFS